MRPEKQLLLDEIKDQMRQAKAFVVTRYDKLQPQLTWDLSQKLKESDSHYEVVKKRLLYKALKEEKIDLGIDEIEGHVGVLFMQGDTAAATKTLFQFKEQLDDGFIIQKGIYEGQIFSPEEVVALATLPPLDELRAQFLGVLQAPSQDLVSVMQSLLTSVIYCLENKIEKEKNV